MLIGVGIGAAVLLALLWVRSAWRKAQLLDESQGGSDYHSVVIECTGSGCKAAKAMEGRVYLSSEAPLFPLPECDRERCGCRYRHRQDRRQENRREEIDAQLAVVMLDGQENRRLRRDRRHH